MEQLCRFLEQQERLFVAWLEKLAQTIVQVKQTYDTQVSRDIALVTELIEELETKQCQPEWDLMQVSVAGPGFALPIVPSRKTWAPNTDGHQLCPSQGVRSLGPRVGLGLGDPQCLLCPDPFCELLGAQSSPE